MGPEHPETAAVMENLGFLFQRIGDYAKAETLYREALRIWRKVCGLKIPDTAESINILASMYEEMGEYAKAEPLYQEALRSGRRFVGQKIPLKKSGDRTQGLFSLAP